MVYKLRVILVIFIIFIFANNVLASLEVSNYSLEKVYGQNSNIKGWINLSVQGEEANSLITSNYGSSISLFDFLNKSIGKNNFECVPQNCNKAYQVSGASVSKSFSLNSANLREKTLGIVLSGSIDNINSIKLTYSSNALTSCNNQIEIDILDDGIIDIANNNTSSSESLCQKSYGCFDSNKVTEQHILSIACQKINLSVAPAFRVGAQVKRELGERTLRADLFDSRFSLKGSCTLPSLALGEEREIYCDINHLVTNKGEYYVCIRVDGVNDPNNRYTIKGYSDKINGCGFANLPTSNIKAELSYKIFAASKQFGNVIQTSINDLLSNGERLSSLSFNYIEDQYGYSLDCDSAQCVIPIKIKGNVDQDVIISNFEIIYSKSGSSVASNNLYDALTSQALINSEYKKINLDVLNFSTPSSTGEFNYFIYYKGTPIMSEEISVAPVPVINYLIPSQGPAAVDIQFFVNVTSPNNLKIKKYIWNFGNGDKRETINNSLTYKYNSTGLFNVTITAIDDQNFNSSKVFIVTIDKPDQVANISLNRKLEQIKNLKIKINEYDPYTKSIIENEINLSDLEYNIEGIKKSYLIASYSEDYIKVVERLNSLKVPDAIVSYESQQTGQFIFNKEEIDIDALNLIAEDKDELIDDLTYKDAIEIWNYENVRATLSYDKIEAIYDTEKRKIVNVYEFNINLNEENDEDVYFFIKNLQNLNFESSVDTIDAGSYTSIKLSGVANKIIFSTTENVNTLDLPVFVSKNLGEYEVIIPAEPICVENDICEKSEGENYKNCRDCQPWDLYIYSLIGIIIFYLIMHIILQEWYKKHYENYLFKNKNYLYNIMNYIQIEVNKGKNDSELEKNLKKSGWNNEQIRYAIRKFYGKRTGMLEIPMDWLFNIFRKNKMPKYDPRMAQGFQGIQRY